MKSNDALIGFVAIFLLGLTMAATQAQPLPGTPLGAPFATPLDLFDGAQMLPGTVVPGDLVLQEFAPPLPNFNRASWSDVVRFFNAPDAFGNVTGFALVTSDPETEVGVVNIGVRYIMMDFNGVVTTFDLPDLLDPNSSFVAELTDPTPWQVPGALYQVHSDVNENDPLVQKFPGAVIAQVGGPNNLVVVLGEDSNAFDTNPGDPPKPPITVTTNMPLVPGLNYVKDMFSDGHSEASDTLNFTAAGLVQLIFSEKTAGVDEELPLTLLDEGTSATYFVQDPVEVPEPATLSLVAMASIFMGIGFSPRGKR